MEKIKLYLDEDISDRLSVALRSRGYNVISAHEVEMQSKTDSEQLEYAIKHGCVILTQNVKHFINLQREYFTKGLQHQGILVTNVLPFKELMRRILNFMNKRYSDEMKNNLDWLQNYK